jgi:hypothetical protein
MLFIGIRKPAGLIERRQTVLSGSRDKSAFNKILCDSPRLTDKSPCGCHSASVHAAWLDSRALLWGHKFSPGAKHISAYSLHYEKWSSGLPQISCKLPPLSSTSDTLGSPASWGYLGRQTEEISLLSSF